MVYGGWIPNYPSLESLAGSSCQFIYHLITGEPGEGPNSFPKWPFPQQVHAYNVAKAHVKALYTPPLKDGRIKRFIVSQGSFTFLDAIKLIKRERPALASRLPREDDPAADKQSPLTFDTSFTSEVLGLRQEEYISAEKTWLDTIDQLLEWEKGNKLNNNL